MQNSQLLIVLFQIIVLQRSFQPILIRASVDALYRDGANVRGDAHMRKSFHAPRMCEYEPS